MEIFLQRFPRLGVDTFVGDVGIFLVPGAFVVLASVSFPIAQAHPAEFVLAVVALHVVATAVFLYTYVTRWALEIDKNVE